MEMYGIPASVIYQDAQERPDHYSDAQKQLLNHLHLGHPGNPRIEEVDDLFCTWNEKTDLASKRREILQQVTEPPKDVADDAVFEGDLKKGKPTFENQNYDKLIKII